MTKTAVTRFLAYGVATLVVFTGRVAASGSVGHAAGLSVVEILGYLLKYILFAARGEAEPTPLCGRTRGAGTLLGGLAYHHSLGLPFGLHEHSPGDTAGELTDFLGEVITALAEWMTGNRHDAEDAVAEAVAHNAILPQVVAFLEGGQTDTEAGAGQRLPQGLRRQVWRKAIGRARDLIRKNARRRVRDVGAGTDRATAVDEDPAFRIDRDALAVDVRAALEGLPTSQREVAVRVLAGQSLKDIGAELKIGTTVYSRWEQAKARLGPRLKGWADTADAGAANGPTDL